MQTATAEPHPTSNSQAVFLGFIDEYQDVDAAVDEAVGLRKDLRARIKGAGFNLAAFDRARREAEKSGEKREAEDREYRRNLEWLGKPLNFQSTMFAEPAPAPAPAETAAISEHQQNQIDGGGFSAGSRGLARDLNPWSPGTLTHQVWDVGWVRGAEALAQSQVTEEPAPQPRRRGRPAGSRNRPKPSTNGVEA